MKGRSSKSHLWNRLTFAVTATVMIGLILVMTGIYVTMNVSMSDVMSKSAKGRVELLAAQNAKIVETDLNVAAAYAKSLAIQMSELTNTGLTEARFQDFAESTLTKYLDDDRIFGAYMAWEPYKSFALTPNGLSYYAYRDGGAAAFTAAHDYDVYGAADYYVVARDTGKPYFTDPFDYTLPTGEVVWLLTASNPVFDANGNLVGVACFDLIVSKISELQFNYGGYSSAYTYTLSNNGIFLSHSQLPERIGSSYGSDEHTDTDAQAVLAAVKSGEETELDGTNALTGGDAYILYSPIHITGVDRTFSSAFAVNVAEVMSERDSMLNTLMLVIVIGAVALYAATFFNIYRLVSPAAKIVKVAEGLERGDLNVEANVTSKNEFGIIFRAIESVGVTLKGLVNETIALTEAAQNGSLSYRADPEKHRGVYRDIVSGVNGTLDAVIAPVQEASGVLVELSRGRLDTAMQGHYKGDHNIIKHALNDTIEALRSYIGELSERLGAMAGGDFSVSIKREYKGDFIRIKDSINTIAESMSAVLADIRSAADQVSAGTLQVSSGSQAISQGATEQAASIEELTASIAEIASQTRENAIGANKASELSASARKKALEGRERMAMLQGAMTEINEASESIYKIIKVIDDIAFQTNILALNAAVEAARAGVHGKGFGVVAEEVRALAGKSKDAASETAALIEGSVKKTEAGTRIADQTAAELEGIVEQVESAAKLVGDIAVASNDQATAIAQVNKGIEQMSQVVQTNSATAQEQAATSEELSGQAEMLKNQVGEFRLK